MKPSALRVLRALRAAGSRGVTTGEFAEGRMPRASARIHELRRQGFAIEAERLSSNAFRFILRGEPDAGVGAGAQLGEEIQHTSASPDPGVGLAALVPPAGAAAVPLFELPPADPLRDAEAA